MDPDPDPGGPKHADPVPYGSPTMVPAGGYKEMSSLLASTSHPEPLSPQRAEDLLADCFIFKLVGFSFLFFVRLSLPPHHTPGPYPQRAQPTSFTFKLSRFPEIPLSLSISRKSYLS
jgi:hypothetical protein